MTSCRTCGNPLNFANGSKCIKCGEPLRPYRSLLEVDVAHAGESWEQAGEKIKRAVDQGLRDQHKGSKSFMEADEQPGVLSFAAGQSICCVGYGSGLGADSPVQE